MLEPWKPRSMNLLWTNFRLFICLLCVHNMTQVEIVTRPPTHDSYLSLFHIISLMRQVESLLDSLKQHLSIQHKLYPTQFSLTQEWNNTNERRFLYRQQQARAEPSRTERREWVDARWVVKRDERGVKKRRKKNRYSLWTACRDTSDPETSALMPSPIPRQKCWHVGVGVYCKGTIWQSSMRLGSQCAFFISLA